MKEIIELLTEKIGARRAAALLAVLQVVGAVYFADYKSRADSTLTATQQRALESVKRAIDQAAEIAAQDAELSLPAALPCPNQTIKPQGATK